MHFEEIGAGTPVLALHGWPVDHRLMSGCLEPFFERRPGYRRLYPDLPGMGRSPADEAVGSSDDVLAEVQRFVDKTIGDEPFLLAGGSYGGYLARAVATARGAQVRGLALICPIGTAVYHADRRVPGRTVEPVDPALVAGLDPEVAALYAEEAVVRSPETLRRIRDDVLSGLAAADEATAERVQQHYALSHEPERGAPFTRPTLILTGRQDDTTGYLDQWDLLPLYPRATFAVLDMAGHNLPIDQPAMFEALLTDWLTRVEEAG